MKWLLLVAPTLALVSCIGLKATKATEEDASEVVFLPVEIAQSIGTDPADWEDPMWD